MNENNVHTESKKKNAASAPIIRVKDESKINRL